MTDTNEVLPALTSEDNHFVNDILSLVSAGSYIARTTIQDPKGAQLMDSCVLAMGLDALRSRFLAKGIDEPDAKVIAGAKFMEKVDSQLKTGVSSKAVLDQLREAMEEAGANFELPPEPKPTQASPQSHRPPGRTVMTDYADDPRYKAFLQDAKEQLPELIGDSQICLALVTESGPDPKFCIELGYMVSLDKPIILVVRPGAKVSSKLISVADEIVEWNGELADSGLSEAVDRLAAKLGD